MPNHKQQTTVQESTAVKWGSCLMEVGPNVGDLVNVGALRDVVWEETFDSVSVETDNAGPIELGIRNHRCAISGNWMEINWDNLARVYSGVHSVVAANTDSVAVTDEDVVLTAYDVTRLAHKNGDGSEVTLITVGDVATPTIVYVRDCDYVITTDAQGWTGISRAFATPIVTASGAITVATPAKTYTLSAETYLANLAIGDHIIVSGCAEAGNNGVKTVTAFTTTVITVDETCTGEAETGTVTITRGAIAAGATVYANTYTYVPLASRTYTGGGFSTFTPQVVRITNSDASTPAKTLQCTIFSATPDGGIKIDFPSDDDIDPALVPIKMNGRLDNDLDSGEQLFEIVDTQQTA